MSRVTDLIHPDDIRNGRVRPPNHVANVVLSRSPENEWNYIKENFPEIIPFVAEGEDIPQDVVEVMLARLDGADNKAAPTQAVSSDG
jgi:hypothetical protein